MHLRKKKAHMGQVWGELTSMLANANISNVCLLIFPRSVVTCFPINPILLQEFEPGKLVRQNVAR